jgi:hypothetical protein
VLLTTLLIAGVARAQEPAATPPQDAPRAVAPAALTPPPPPATDSGQAPTGVVLTPDVQRYAQFLKSKLVVLELGFFSGLTLKQGGRELSPGLFGDGLVDAFAESERASERARAYRTQRVAGLAVLAVGTVATTAGLVGLVGLAGSRSNARTPLIMWSVVALAGTVALTVGALLLGASQANLWEAVNTWNAELLDAALPGPGFSFEVGDGRGGLAGLSVSGSF